MRLRDFFNRAFLIRLAVLGLLLGFIGFVVVVSGIVPIRASSGHWGVTKAFMSFAMRRSVETWSAAAKVPELDDPALIVKGAAPYDLGCKPCHGAPGEARSGVARELTPAPPWLPDVVDAWEPDELFYIVKHGVKMTGMPAWPALHRDDEVWAVVAFIRMLSELSREQYRQLAGAGNAAELVLVPPSDVPAPVLDTCARCHGVHGERGQDGAFPRLAGLSREYLYASLEAYADGRRHSGIMQPIAAGLEQETMRELADWYSRGGAAPAHTHADTRVAAVPIHAPPLPDAAAPLPRLHATPAALTLGERIARHGIPERKVPSCIPCHGPSEHPRNPYYPSLAGQYPAYLALQLRLFHQERRGGTAFHRLMHEVARNLSMEEMAAVALWYGSLE